MRRLVAAVMLVFIAPVLAGCSRKTLPAPLASVKPSPNMPVKPADVGVPFYPGSEETWGVKNSNPQEGMDFATARFASHDPVAKVVEFYKGYAEEVNAWPNPNFRELKSDKGDRLLDIFVIGQEDGITSITIALKKKP